MGRLGGPKGSECFGSGRAYRVPGHWLCAAMQLLCAGSALHASIRNARCPEHTAKQAAAGPRRTRNAAKQGSSTKLGWTEMMHKGFSHCWLSPLERARTCSLPVQAHVVSQRCRQHRACRAPSAAPGCCRAVGLAISSPALVPRLASATLRRRRTPPAPGRGVHWPPRVSGSCLSRCGELNSRGGGADTPLGARRRVVIAESRDAGSSGSRSPPGLPQHRNVQFFSVCTCACACAPRAKTKAKASIKCPENEIEFAREQEQEQERGSAAVSALKHAPDPLPLVAHSHLVMSERRAHVLRVRVHPSRTRDGNFGACST